MKYKKFQQRTILTNVFKNLFLKYFFSSAPSTIWEYWIKDLVELSCRPRSFLPEKIEKKDYIPKQQNSTLETNTVVEN